MVPRAKTIFPSTVLSTLLTSTARNPLSSRMVELSSMGSRPLRRRAKRETWRGRKTDLRPAEHLLQDHSSGVCGARVRRDAAMSTQHGVIYLDIVGGHTRIGESRFEDFAALAAA